MSKEIETIFLEREDEYEYEETVGGQLPKGDTQEKFDLKKMRVKAHEMSKT